MHLTQVARRVANPWSRSGVAVESWSRSASAPLRFGSTHRGSFDPIENPSFLPIFGPNFNLISTLIASHVIGKTENNKIALFLLLHMCFNTSSSPSEFLPLEAF
jgi:hypothetical protein